MTDYSTSDLLGQGCLYFYNHFLFSCKQKFFCKTFSQNVAYFTINVHMSFEMNLVISRYLINVFHICVQNNVPLSPINLAN